VRGFDVVRYEHNDETLRKKTTDHVLVVVDVAYK